MEGERDRQGREKKKERDRGLGRDGEKIKSGRDKEKESKRGDIERKV